MAIPPDRIAEGKSAHEHTGNHNGKEQRLHQRHFMTLWPASWTSIDELSEFVTTINVALAILILLSFAFTMLSIWVTNKRDLLAKTAGQEQEARIASANERAAQAYQSAAETNKVAASANVLAEQARAEQQKLTQENLSLALRVEEERKARFLIEERIADRRLSPDERRRLRDTMRAFPPIQSWQLVTYSNDGEAQGLGSDIEEALVGSNGAGWAVPNRLTDQASTPIRGIAVEFRKDADSATNAAADALAKALRAERLLEVVGPNPFTPRMQQVGRGGSISVTLGGRIASNVPITVIVGRKP